MSPAFRSRVRVRSYELDMLGHVNNAVFLNWLEQARLEAFEVLGWSVEDLVRRRWLSNVARIEIDYRREVRFGDVVDVTTGLERLGRTSLTLAHRLVRVAGVADEGTEPAGRRGAEGPDDRPDLVAEARVVVVWLDEHGRPTPVPREVRRALEASRGF